MIVPGKTASFILGLIGLLTCFFPVLSLPCSITGFVLASRAKRYGEAKGIDLGSTGKAGYWLSLLSIVATALIILIALPGIIQRRLGQ